MRSLIVLLFLSNQAYAFSIDWIARLKCFVVTAPAYELRGTTNFISLPNDSSIYSVVLGKGQVLGAWNEQSGYHGMSQSREEVMWLLRYEVQKEARNGR